MAQCSAAGCLLAGRGVEKNEEKAAEWYLKAAESGYAVAQFCLGMSYLNGNGVKQDKKKAEAWLTKAAMQRHAGALGALKKMKEAKS